MKIDSRSQCITLRPRTYLGRPRVEFDLEAKTATEVTLLSLPLSLSQSLSLSLLSFVVAVVMV